MSQIVKIIKRALYLLLSSQVYSVVGSGLVYGVPWVGSMLEEGGVKWVKSDECSRVLVVNCKLNFGEMYRQVVS